MVFRTEDIFSVVGLSSVMGSRLVGVLWVGACAAFVWGKKVFMFC